MIKYFDTYATEAKMSHTDDGGGPAAPPATTVGALGEAQRARSLPDMTHNHEVHI